MDNNYRVINSHVTSLRAVTSLVARAMTSAIGGARSWNPGDRLIVAEVAIMALSIISLRSRGIPLAMMVWLSHEGT